MLRDGLMHRRHIEAVEPDLRRATGAAGGVQGQCCVNGSMHRRHLEAVEPDLRRANGAAGGMQRQCCVMDSCIAGTLKHFSTSSRRWALLHEREVSGSTHGGNCHGQNDLWCNLSLRSLGSANLGTDSTAGPSGNASGDGIWALLHEREVSGSLMRATAMTNFQLLILEVPLRVSS